MPRTRIGWGALPLAAVFLGGCGSSWTIPNDVLSTLSLAWYYPDVDGDGWGDPGGEPEQLASPDVGGGLTATNDRDCAADDDQITGQIGAICPDDLAFGGTVSGVSYPGDGTAEYVMTHGGDAPTTSASLAETDCGLWGSTVASEILPFGAGQLASIQVAVELDPLAEIAQRDGAFAGWIGNQVDAGFEQLSANIATLERLLGSPPLAIIPPLAEPTASSAAKYFTGARLFDARSVWS